VPLPKPTGPALGSLLAGLSVALFVGMLREERPNVVFVVVDTLRADAISTALGNPDTPHLAELAAGGVAFREAFTHAPMTLPAHASLFSGRHPYETGVYNNGEPVPADVPLLAETLRGHGYQTSAVVSLATLWPHAPGRGLDRGFDRFDTGSLEIAPAEDTEERVAQALDALDPDRPFFLFAHFADPHEPYDQHAPWFEGEESPSRAEAWLDGERVGVVPTSSAGRWELELELTPGKHELVLRSEDEFKLRSFEAVCREAEVATRFLRGELLRPEEEVTLELSMESGEVRQVTLRAWLNDLPSTRELQARYASEVRAADAALGALVRELRSRGLWENTLVVFTADHGEALGEHGTVGHVVNLYDELLHVPLVLRLPHDRRDPELEAAERALVRHVDVAPTVLDSLGLGGLEPTSGESLLGPGERVLMAETHPPEAPRALHALRDETYKLVYDPGEDDFEMYRLGPDPLELDDVFAHQGHLRETWQLVLRKLADQVEPQTARDEGLQRRLSALGY